MSKSLGNVVVPWEVIDRFGADAFRWYFFTSKQPWDGYRFTIDAVGEAVRLFLRQLWNVYGFHVLYANAAQPGQGGDGERSELDRWALSRLAATVETVRERLDAYDATLAGKAIADFVEDLSNWYVRRSRRRFWDGDAAALATLEEISSRSPSCSLRSRRSSPMRSTTTSTASWGACTSATSPSPVIATASWSSRWRPRARRCASASPRAGRATSSCASRCARR